MNFAWVLIAAAWAASAAEEEGFVPLFDGSTLGQWGGAAGFWRVEDGAITGETTAERTLAHHSYLIWRGGEFEDFELRLSFRLLSGNSGVQYRSRDLGDQEVAGYQCNIETKKPGRTAILEEMKGGRGGALAEVGRRVEIGPDGSRMVLGQIGDPARIEASIDMRGWNQLVIIARGDRLIHKLNGHVVVDVTDRQKGNAAGHGILALQLHAGRPMKVQFKDVRLKRLDREACGRLLR